MAAGGGGCIPDVGSGDGGYGEEGGGGGGGGGMPGGWSVIVSAS